MPIKYDAETKIAEVDYDASIMNAFADKMYAMAKTTIIMHCILGTLLGCGAGFFFSHEANRILLVVFGGVIGCILGYFVAQWRALQLRLMAQFALCIARIEHNTREKR